MRSVCHGRIRKHTPSHCQPYWAKRSCYRTPHTRESFWLLRGGPSCLGFGIQWPCPAKSHWACPICPTCWHNHSIRSLTEIWQILISMLGSWSLSIRGAGLRWGGGSKNWGSSKGINQIRLWGKWTIVTSGASLIRWASGYPCKVSCWLPYVPYKDRKIQPSTIDGYSSAIADKLGNSPFNISKDKNLARLLDSFHRDRPKGRRGIPSWNLSLVLHQLNKAPFEPIKEPPWSFWPSRRYSSWHLGRANAEVRFMLDKTKILEGGDVGIAPGNRLLATDQGLIGQP